MKKREEKVINDLVYFKNLKIVQNKNYFNFSLDSIILPNFVQITPNTKMILDLCTGNAPIPLVLSTKTNAKIIGVELQKEIYELAKETVNLNKIDNVETIPPHDVSANDVDLDAYTNTKGYTIRNRVRHDVASLDFSVETMSGEELHNFLARTTNVWLDCYFFYEPAWSFVSKKMYRSGTVKYTKYYVDSSSPNKNIYTDIQFSFIEQ